MEARHLVRKWPSLRWSTCPKTIDEPYAILHRSAKCCLVNRYLFEADLPVAGDQKNERAVPESSQMITLFYLESARTCVEWDLRRPVRLWIEVAIEFKYEPSSHA